MVYLGKRQSNCYGDDCNDGNWWYSDTSEAIKWAVVAALFFGVLLFFLAAYLHAKRRLRKGQAPLAYHRWLLPRSQRMRYAPQQPFMFYQHQQGPYEMHPYPPPPPAYHHNEMPPPPRYEPPQGASKTNPDQQYPAPPGPPPASGPSRSGPPSPVSPIQERRQSLREQYNVGQPEHEEAQLPPRPQTSGRSWNPLNRFK
ncbi:MAG: hypothetical protein LQ338_007326 [Usnochroma carphineum]|nr:MAG: hypothetical protein LQ338_007326 [Usnochroma carphineum]